MYVSDLYLFLLQQSRRGSVGEADETRSTKTEISISKTDFMSIYSDDAGSVAASASSSAALVHVLKPDSIAILGCIGSMVLKRRAFVYHMEQIGSTGSVHSQGEVITMLGTWLDERQAQPVLLMLRICPLRLVLYRQVPRCAHVQ